MINSDIKFIALDLDGTLLDDNKKIPRQAVDIIKEVMNRGVIVTLVSARPLRSMLPYAQQLGLEAPLISLSGSYITDMKQERILLRKPVDLLKFREIISIFEERNFYIKVYYEGQLVVQEAIQETIEYKKIFGVPYTEVGSKGLRRLQEPPLRIFLYNEPLQIQEAAQILKGWSEYFHVIRDTDHGLEIVERTVSKGAALKVICQEMDILMSNVMAIGNEGSDISMIREAGLGIAMGNACAELKQYAVDVTKTNTECGVGYAIQKYILNR
ncbi:MAG: Cof-like hydrolase [Firmicutes bacterium]|nr:Cof-like hydrolase [Bacillota bacterium]